MKKINLFAKNIVITLGVISAMFTISCNEEDAPTACLEPPCGKITENVTNITVHIVDAGENITNVNIAIDEEVTPLVLDGIDLENEIYFSCWQIIPDLKEDSMIIIGYELNGEQVIGFATREFATTNQLVLQINGEAAILQDYKECIDVI